MRDPRHENTPKVKVAIQTQVIPVNVILVSVVLLVLLLIVRGVSGT